jgi:hypothetical protein
MAPPPPFNAPACVLLSPVKFLGYVGDQQKKFLSLWHSTVEQRDHCKQRHFPLSNVKSRERKCPSPFFPQGLRSKQRKATVPFAGGASRHRELCSTYPVQVKNWTKREISFKYPHLFVGTLQPLLADWKLRPRLSWHFWSGVYSFLCLGLPQGEISRSPCERPGVETPDLPHRVQAI